MLKKTGHLRYVKVGTKKKPGGEGLRPLYIPSTSAPTLRCTFASPFELAQLPFADGIDRRLPVKLAPESAHVEFRFELQCIRPCSRRTRRSIDVKNARTLLQTIAAFHVSWRTPRWSRVNSRAQDLKNHSNGATRSGNPHGGLQSFLSIKGEPNTSKRH